MIDLERIRSLGNIKASVRVARGGLSAILPLSALEKKQADVVEESLTMLLDTLDELSAIEATGEPDDESCIAGDDTPATVPPLTPTSFSPVAVDPASLLALPDVPQDDPVSCAVACCASVSQFFGIPPTAPDEWRRRLGTTEDGTEPEPMVRELAALGLQVDARENMTLDDLRACWLAGEPVIVPIQDYASKEWENTDESGHYVVVIGVALGMVFVQDPMEDETVDDSGTDAAPGRVMIDQEKFVKVWHDKGDGGKRFVCYGIAVGPRAPLLELATFDESQHPRGHEGNPGEFVAKSSKPVVKTKAKIKIASNDPILRPRNEQEVPNRLKIFFGDENAAPEAATVAGAPDDAEVTLYATTDGKLRVEVSHPDFQQTMIRFIGKDESGEKYVENSMIDLKKSAQGKGLGTDIFSRGVEAAKTAGLNYIKCHAARKNASGQDRFNGYETWPKMGYDLPIDNLDDDDDEEKACKDYLQDQFPKARSILDVYDTPGGAEAWKEIGCDLFDMKFDLDEKSRSMQVFKSYMAKRADRKPSGVAMSTEAYALSPEGHEEIDLAEWEKAALDDVWKERNQQQGDKHHFGAAELATDAHGREHKGKGTGGGQFTPAEHAHEAVKATAGPHNLAPMHHVRAELSRRGITDRNAQEGAINDARRAGHISASGFEERGGNVLNVEKNKEIAEEAERAKNTYNTLVNRNGII